jgi:hypothetical protein
MEVQEELVTHLLAAHNTSSILNTTWLQYYNGTMQVSHTFYASVIEQQLL